MTHRITQASKADDHIARVNQLFQNAFHERMGHRWSLNRSIAMRTCTAVGETTGAQLNE